MSLGSNVFLILTKRKGQRLTCWPLCACRKRVLVPLSMTVVWPHGRPDCTSQDKIPQLCLESNLVCRARLVEVRYLWNSSEVLTFYDLVCVVEIFSFKYSSILCKQRKMNHILHKPVWRFRLQETQLNPDKGVERHTAGHGASCPLLPALFLLFLQVIPTQGSKSL